MTRWPQRRYIAHTNGGAHLIEILQSRRCLWRNRYAPTPVLAADLSLGEAASWTAASLAEPLIAILQEKLRDLRVAASMDAAEFAAELAQQMQARSDVTAARCGVYARDPEKRTATIFFSCKDEFLAKTVLAVTAQLVTQLTNPALAPPQLIKLLQQGLYHTAHAGLDQSTQLMLGEAERRNIPWFRINRTTRFIQLGQGARQRRTFETLRSTESPIGRELSRDKVGALQMLKQIGLPVGEFAEVRDMNSALKAAERIGYPVVLKPVIGKQGISVYSKLLNADELRTAYAKVAGKGRFLVQRFFPGEDHRILIVDGKLISAAHRIAASVTGDGKRTIRELVDQYNNDPARHEAFDKMAKPIPFDEETDRMLSHQGLTRDSVPKKGQYVRMRLIANTSNGGMAKDVTHLVHPDNARAAIKAAKAMELRVAGVDFIVGDIAKSWHDVGGGICEVNSIVGLRVHLLANADIDVVGPIIETIYPKRDNGRIPTAMITGTKGKSTTTRMLGRILACAGHTAGVVTTDGVVVGEEEIAKGDLAGSSGASIVLRDPTVSAVALETARGGLIKSGMYLDWCDVAALTNIGREQIGMDGIETVEEMAALKRKVLEAARKAVILNADDAHCAAMSEEFTKSIRTILFSLDAKSSVVRQHIRNGGEAIILAGGSIELQNGAGSEPLLRVSELPSTMNGLIRANIANAMAAAGLAIGLGVVHEHIRDGLRRYDNSIENARGRFSFADGFPMKIMFDRAAQAPSCAAVMPVIDAIPVKGKRICAFTVAGNRPAWAFEETVAALIGHFDRYICFEFEEYRRGKKPGEIAAILSGELKKAGIEEARISVTQSNMEAARLVAGEAMEDDLVAVLGMGADSVEEYRAAFREAGK